MLISATLSKPSNTVCEILGKEYIKVKITAESSAQKNEYFVEMFTKQQVFHKHFTLQEAEDFIQTHAGTTFKACVKRTESQEITIVASKKGKISTITKNTSLKLKTPEFSLDKKKKNYLIPEGKPVPFLVLLGIMNDDGKVISQKFDKFRQINRFLEFIDDIIPEVTEQINKEGQPRPVRIADFGCGKSYLTFAVHYYLKQIKNIPCQIEGLDLKEDVIAYCNKIAAQLKLENLIFHTGDISKYSGANNPDIVITLHACDTATDFALKYAVSRQCKAILSVPCCQHQINTELTSKKSEAFGINDENFQGLLKWGIIREKFSSLVTDTLRAQWLEQQNYTVQLLEFIDMEHTPKNILIRAVKNSREQKNKAGNPALMDALNIHPEIWK